MLGPPRGVNGVEFLAAPAAASQISERKSKGYGCGECSEGKRMRIFSESAQTSGQIFMVILRV